MFQFSIGINVSDGQSSSGNDLVKELAKKVEQMKTVNDERYQEFQESEEKQNNEITRLREDLEGVQKDRDDYKLKYLAMKKANHHLQWEKEKMEHGIENTFYIPRKWINRKISKYEKKHPYKEPTESDLEDE